VVAEVIIIVAGQERENEPPPQFPKVARASVSPEWRLDKA
jgi:hypothetical protein